MKKESEYKLMQKFNKNWENTAVLIIFIAINFAAIILFFVSKNINLEQTGLDRIEVITVLQRFTTLFGYVISIANILLGFITTFLFYKRTKSKIPKHPYIKQMLLFSALSLWYCMIELILFSGYLGTIESRYWALNVFQTIFYNIFLLSFLFLLFGMLLSEIKKWYLILSLILPLLCGYYFTQNRLYSVFQIFVPNYNWTDFTYGIPNENVRLNILLFWIFLLLGFTLLLYKHNNRQKISFVFLVFCLFSISAVSLYFVTKPNIVFRSDSVSAEQNYGFFAADKYYYQHNYKNNEIQESAPEFKVEEYDISFRIYNCLKANVEMHIIAEDLQNDFDFTLYHGFQVTAITDEDGNPFSYRRDRDLLTVFTNKSTTDLTIKVTYTGGSDSYYANSQSIALHGNFPYYPIPGKYNIYEEYVEYDITPGISIIDRQESTFKISVNTPKIVYSNLKSIDRNKFEGKAKYVSLVSGLYHSVEVDRCNIIYSDISTYSKEQFLKLIQETNNCIRKFDNTLHIKSGFQLENKTIVFGGSLNEFFVVPFPMLSLDDHYIAREYHEDIDGNMLALNILYSKIDSSRLTKMNSILAFQFCNFIDSVVFKELNEYPSYLQIDGEDTREQILQNRGEKVLHEIKKSDMIVTIFADTIRKINHEGTSDHMGNFLRQIYHFLCEEPFVSVEHDLNFISDLSNRIFVE